MMFANAGSPLELDPQLGFRHSARGRRPSALICAPLAVLLLVQTAHGQSAHVVEADADAAQEQTTAPPLTLRIEGQSPVARELLEQELTRVVGRPISSDGQPTDGVVTLSFDKDPRTGSVGVRVRYEPPPDQLLRSDVVPTDLTQAARRIAVLVQSLLRQDAGVTVVTPPPPPMPNGAEMSPSPPSPSTPPPPSPSTPPSPRSKTEARAPQHTQRGARRLQSWRVSAGARLGLGGSVAASGMDARGRLTGESSLLGGSIQAIAPSIGRLRLGVEAVIDSVEAEAPLEDGRAGSMQALYVGVSAMPSFNVWTTGQGLEVNVSGHMGVVRTSGLDLSGFADSTLQTGGDVGYRVGLAVDASYWLTEHLGLTAALGLDETKVAVTSYRRMEGAGDGSTGVRNDVSVWVKQPYLRLAAMYRF